MRELDERGFDRALVDAPCSGLGVLARRPDLRWRAQPLPELQLELLRAAAERTKPGGTIVYAVCTLNADENEAVVDALGLAVEPLGAEWPQYAHPTRPEFLLTRPDRDRTSGFFIARLRPNIALCPGATGSRTVEVEPSLYGADFSRLGEQIEALLDAGCRVFHFDVGDGHFVEPMTMGPIVLQWISPRVHDARRCGRRAPDGRAAGEVLRGVAAAGGDSVTFHYEAVDDVAATIAAAREHGLQAGVAFNPETEPEQVAAVAGDADLVLCMSIHPGYSGPAVPAGDVRPRRALRSALPARRSTSRSTAASAARTSASCATRGATLLVAASSIFAHDDPPAAYRGLVRDLA